MNNLMKMRMLTGDNDKGREYDRSPRSEYEPMDARFRDRTGREHYDNGRFAPMRSEYDGGSTGGGYSNGGYGGGYDSPRMGDDEGEEYRRKWTITENRNAPMRGQGYWPAPSPSAQYNGEINEDGMRRIYGFGVLAGGRGIQNNYRSPTRDDEMSWRHGSTEKGYSHSEMIPPFNREMAEEWMDKLENEDGSRGPHWTIEQVKQLMQQRGVQGDPLKVWVGMNAEYSDMVITNRRYGIDRPEYYLDAAMARWINDKDAVDDKLAAYYACVVRH